MSMTSIVLKLASTSVLCFYIYLAIPYLMQGRLPEMPSYTKILYIAGMGGQLLSYFIDKYSEGQESND